MADVEVLELQDFVREVQSVSEHCLQLLAREEHTSRLLDGELSRSCSLSFNADRLVGLLKASAPSGKTDRGDLVMTMETARDTVRAVYNLLSAAQGHASDAPVLTRDTAMVAAYAKLVAQTATLHNKLNELAWLVGEHEADADERLPGVFGSADELFHAMGG